ncbi:MAG: alpha-2-macroglobulin [Alphaproteobacteria bacterium]
MINLRAFVGALGLSVLLGSAVAQAEPMGQFSRSDEARLIIAQAPGAPAPRPQAAPGGQAQPQAQGQRPAAAPPGPPLRAYQNEAAAELSRRLEASRARVQVNEQRPIADVRRDADSAAQRSDFRSAASAWENIALRSGQDSAPWVRYAQMLAGVRTDNWQERQTLADESLGAAYLGYRRAANRNEEAFALAQIRQLFVQREQWRPAIDVAKAALDARDTPETRDAYTRLREQRGFRVLRTDVQSDSASPRVCFVFSEDLKKGRFDFSPFVRQQGVNAPPITVNDSQICIDGLRHGERYTFQLREGLPAENGEALLRTSDSTVYVRDRAPAVRFTARAYVLPKSGQRGVPVVSVNVASIDVAIHRFGDRSIAQTVAEDFPKPLDGYELAQAVTDRAIPVWSGTMQAENRLNADVTTAFPVDEAIQALEPGVYVMTAKPTVAPRPTPDSDGPQDGMVAQWFIVSDLGLTGLSGSDGVHGFVHSLGSAKPLADVEVRLVARSNEILATRKTDASGHVRFERGLTRGEGALTPALLVAIGTNGDYGFLNLRQPAFDLSDRGVAGREIAGPLDAFVVPERGVYRPGETVNLTALLRDGKGDAVPQIPLTLILERPDGVEYRRVVTQDMGAGGRVAAVNILSSAMTGTWRVKAVTDPRQPPAGEAKFLVEDFVPDRIAFDLTAQGERLSRTQPFGAQLAARYLFGLPGADLGVEGEVVLETTGELPDFAGYRFGLDDEEAKREREPLPDGLVTDERGNLRISGALPRLEDATRPLKATLTVRVSEPGGRAVERSASLPVLPGTPLVGVKPMFPDDRVAENDTAVFEVIAVAADGRTRQQRTLTWQLLRLETRWQWSRGAGGWESTAITTTRRVADGRVDATPAAAARIAQQVPWGKYRLEVGDIGSPATTIVFESGYGAGGTADTPDVLEMSLDKPAYHVGDTMTIAVNARFAGTATVTILGDRLHSERTVEVPQGQSRITVPVAEGWGAGAYAVVFLRRPLDVQAGRMPGRAIGLTWFGVDSDRRKLNVTLGAPDRMAPRSAMRVPVRIEGLASGEQAYLTVAAVDLGILTLTDYKAPKPDDYYLGQRRLQAEVRDLYGLLLDGMSAARGAIRSGGDGQASRFNGAPPAQDPLSLFSGLVTVRGDGTAEVSFDIPDFNGTVRVMAMAWTPTKHGSASKDVIARDPVVVQATLPRVLGNADRATARLDLINAEAPAGDYQVTVTPSGPLQAATAPTTVRLAGGGGRGSVSLPLTANGVGVGGLDVRLTGPNGLDVSSRYRLGVRPALPEVTRRTVMTIEPSQSVTLSGDLIGDYVPGSARVSVSVGPSAAIDVAGLIMALDRYPFGCSEQITSRALPLLYLDVLSAAEGGLGLETPVAERVRDSIDRLLSRQSSSGSFGLWTAGQSEDNWLDAYVTDFLTRARERGHAVPEQALRISIDKLRSFVNATDGVGTNDGMDLAYAHYVLARAGRGSLSDLRWLADTRLGDFKSAIGRGQLGAALALMGDTPRAERVFASAVAQLRAPDQTDQARFDYGSRLRDAAAIMALGTEARVARRIVTDAQRVLEDMQARTRAPSTQEKVWLVLAAQALIEDARRISLDVGGSPHQGALNRTIATDDLARGLVLRNSGSEVVRAVVGTQGTPRQAEPAAAAGFTLQRQYFTLDGRPVDIARVAQGTRLVVVLTMGERQPQLGQIMLVDRLPAGFEIDNPSLVASAETSALKWLATEAEQPDWRAFRDDRFMAAYSRASDDGAAWKAAYMIRAVTPGRYVLPPATIEDMYRPERFARTAAGTVEVTSGP